MKTFEEFKAALKNGELKSEIEEFAKSAKDKADSEKDILFCEFAKNIGYDVSVEDLAAEKAAAKEMSDEEIKAVAGGGEMCTLAMYCFLIFVPWVVDPKCSPM